MATVEGTGQGQASGRCRSSARGIENGLHWVVDVAFNEDRMRQSDRKGIENLALLNRLAESLLRQDKTVKAGVKWRRKTAGWDNDYLLHLLFDSP